MPASRGYFRPSSGPAGGLAHELAYFIEDVAPQTAGVRHVAVLVGQKPAMQTMQLAQLQADVGHQSDGGEQERMTREDAEHQPEQDEADQDRDFTPKVLMHGAIMTEYYDRYYVWGEKR